MQVSIKIIYDDQAAILPEKMPESCDSDSIEQLHSEVADILASVHGHSTEGKECKQ